MTDVLDVLDLDVVAHDGLLCLTWKNSFIRRLTLGVSSSRAVLASIVVGCNRMTPAERVSEWCVREGPETAGVGRLAFGMHSERGHE
jgi:hypothetical protein